MPRLVPLSICVAVLAALFGARADERMPYKSVHPNGRIVCSDEPTPNAKTTEKITVERHAADPQAAEAAQRALGLTREQLLKDAAARSARQKQLDNEIDAIYSEFKDADARRAQGRGVQEGDRQGRRLLAAYTQRQRYLQRAADQKSQQLERLLRERAALQ